MRKYIIAAALIVAFSASSDAQQRATIAVSADGRVIGSAVSPEPGAIIIELKAAPLLERGATTTAEAGVDALLDRLGRDLAQIESRLSTRATTAARPPILAHRYKLVFAGASATVEPEAVEEIRKLDYVRRVYPDRVVMAHLAGSVTQVGASATWERFGVRGAGAVVAVLDTGVDYTHAAFGGGFGEGQKVRGGRDFVNNDADPMDDHGHGTHVAGIVAGSGGRVVGVAPDARLLAYKVLDASGRGRDSWVLAALEEVARQRPDVVNMSLGRPKAGDDPVIRAVENASAAGILFAVSAGNGGEFLDIGSPAAAPSAITVGAIDSSGELAWFSSKGPVQSSGAIKPEVVAPGVDIVSAYLRGGLQEASGTSMAAPHVAGVAALLRSIHPDWTAAQIRSALISRARPVDAEIMAAGAGMIHALDAAAAVVQPSIDMLAFGVSDHRQPVWAVSRSLTIVNRSGEAQSYSVVIDGLRDGIALTATEQSLTVPAGETARLQFDLSIDHAKVVAQRGGSLSYAGFIRLKNDNSSVAVPWAFVRASRVRVAWTGDGEATVRVGTLYMQSESQTRRDKPAADLFIGAGAASIWVSGGTTSAVHHVFAENVDFATTNDFAFGPADAPHRVRFNTTDAFGRSLAERQRTPARDIMFRHRHFAARALDALIDVAPGQEIFLSNASGNLQLLVFERAFDEEPRATWIAQHAPVFGVQGDVELTVDPDHWKLLPTRGVIPSDLRRPYHVVWAAIHASVGMATLTSVVRPIHEHPDVPRTETSSWIVPSTSGFANASVMIEIGERGDTSPAAGREALSPDLFAQFTAVADGLLAGSGRIAKVADQTIASGETVVIGEGPVHPSAFVLAIEDFMAAAVQWVGPYEEERPYDAKRTKGVLYDKGGAVVATGSVPPRFYPGPAFFGTAEFEMLAELPQAGPYRFEAVNGSFQVAGMDARASLSVDFDSSRDDSVAPMITSLRISDGSGRTVAAVPRASASTLTFSAIDLAPSALTAVRREKTRVEYRPHGNADDAPWRSMTAVELGTDFVPSRDFRRFPAGVAYRVDLSEATTSRGPLDLRIAVEDDAGNRTVYVLEPAFVVGRVRRRAVSP